MRILGVDPGTLRTGVGVVETSGSRYHLVHFEIISVPPSQPIAKRLRAIFHTLGEIIRCYQPQALALENIFYHKNVRSMLRIGEARSCALLAAADQNVDVIEYPPAKVKQSVTGNGRASKEQMQAMVKTLLNMKELPPSDGADALALAICHLHHYQFKKIRDLSAASPKTLKSFTASGTHR